MYHFKIKQGLYLREAPQIVEVMCDVAFSGAGAGKNNPLMQTVKDVGPLPVGAYWIGAAQDHPHLGPVAMALVPVSGMAVYNRSGFFLHGGTLSHGCIILPRPARERIEQGSDRLLVVTTGGT